MEPAIRKLTVVASLLVFSLLADKPAAHARGACKPDIKKFCKGVLPGKGRLVRCLFRHRDKVSPECKEQARRDFEKLFQISADCGEDAQRFCAEVVPGRGRIAACLLKHEQELSPNCREHALKARKGIENLLLGPCKQDREKFCKDVKAGEGRILQCLADHKAELTPRCRNKVNRVERHKK